MAKKQSIDYPFWINDFDRVKNHRDKYPSLQKIFESPISFWYGDNPKKSKEYLANSIRRLIKRAKPQLPILVTYNIPFRDIGQHSRGGADSREKYLDYIRRFSEGVGDNKPIVIFEPDALPHCSLLSDEDKNTRLELMREGLQLLTDSCSALVYIDVGHSGWLQPEEVVELLDKVSNPNVRGFSVNVSNYRTTEESLRWARKICKWRENDYFVIDTSRNGNGPNENEWCNPKGRALGTKPTCETDYKKCDAYLWVKIPGESDGKCNGGPRAGKFWPEQGEELVRNSL